jgi:hypothetical protein
MATPIYAGLHDTTSFLSVYTSTGSFLYKSIQLPTIYPSTIGRVVYLKEASEFPGVPIFTVSSATNQTIEASTTLGISRHQAITLQASVSSSTYYWSLLNGYLGLVSFSTQQLPVQSVPIHVSTASQLFVDLRTQSKTVVLPRIQTLSQTSSSCLYMTIKDAYGWASTSTLYVSSSYPDTLEVSSINNSIRLDSNFASVDMIANPVLQKWNLVNFYDGSLVSRP